MSMMDASAKAAAAAEEDVEEDDDKDESSGVVSYSLDELGSVRQLKCPMEAFDN